MKYLALDLNGPLCNVNVPKGFFLGSVSDKFQYIDFYDDNICLKVDLNGKIHLLALMFGVVKHFMNERSLEGSLFESPD